MKIAFFSDNFYPELSGISDSILEISKELIKRGHKIKIFAPQYPSRDFKKGGSLAAKKIIKQILVYRFFSFPYPNSPTGQARLVLPSFWRWLYTLNFKPDIIHTHLPFGVGIEALIAAKITHVPLVGTSHTPISEFLKYSPIANKTINHLSLKFVSWYYNKCCFVSAPSQSVFAEMAQYGFTKPHEVVSNPIDLKEFYPSADPQSLKKYLGLTPNVILYTGRLAQEKNIDIIIRAFKKASKQIFDMNLVITGHGSDEQRLKSLAKKLGLKNKIKFVGFVSEKMLAKYHQAADIFMIMSTAETQSISLMRSFACGIPAIAARARALPEYLRPGQGFLVEPWDYEKAAEKIIYLFRNPKERHAMGQKALNFVQQFSAPIIAKKWEKIYSNIIKKY